MTDLPGKDRLPYEETPRLEQRVREMLEGLPGAVAFNGLRRALGVHPESLTRALRRLEREGTIERTGQGYRLSGEIAADRPSPVTGALAQPALAELKLPPTEGRAEVLARLAGRWFGDYRWIGYFEQGGSTTLVWSHRLGQERLWLRLRGDLLEIHSSAGTEGPGSAAYELLHHVLTALRTPRRHAAVATLTPEGTDALSWKEN
jgi:DNA-binding Lrp family transcriptional regulator